MDDSKPFHQLGWSEATVGLKPIPHLAGDGSERPPLIALAGFEERVVSTLEISGDAMRPDLHPGDLVVFTRHSGLVEDGGLYILAAPSGMMVRRLQQMADGGVIAVASNPACRHEPIGPGSETGIVGAVVAVVHRRF